MGRLVRTMKVTADMATLCEQDLDGNPRTLTVAAHEFLLLCRFRKRAALYELVS